MRREKRFKNQMHSVNILDDDLPRPGQKSRPKAPARTPASCSGSNPGGPGTVAWGETGEDPRQLLGEKPGRTGHSCLGRRGQELLGETVAEVRAELLGETARGGQAWGRLGGDGRRMKEGASQGKMKTCLPELVRRREGGGGLGGGI